MTDRLNKPSPENIDSVCKFYYKTITQIIANQQADFTHDTRMLTTHQITAQQS